MIEEEAKELLKGLTAPPIPLEEHETALKALQIAAGAWAKRPIGR